MQNLIRKNFTQVPNELINDREIDKSARFLFIYLCSKPEEWEYRNADLCSALNCSDDTLRKYMNELAGKGWISKAQKVKHDGTFGGNDIVLHPYPNFSGTVPKPEPKKPGSEKNRNRKTSEHNNTELKSNTELFKNTDISLPDQILLYLNERKGGRGFEFTASNLSPIKTRIKEKFTIDDFKKVIDAGCIKWGADPEMKGYIRPATLFGSKFNAYLIEAEGVIANASKAGSKNFKYEPSETAILNE